MCSSVAPNFLPLRGAAAPARLPLRSVAKTCRGRWTRPFSVHCKIRKGHKRLRRNGPVGLTCRAGSCKREYRDQRRTRTGDHTGTATVSAAVEDAEDLPSDMSVVRLYEILGERCCQPSRLGRKHRASPLRRKVYHQEYLVRGSFLEDGSEDEGEGEDEEDEGEDEAPYAPKDDMYWIAQDMLIKAIGGAQVKKAIAARQKQVKRTSSTLLAGGEHRLIGVVASVLAVIC